MISHISHLRTSIKTLMDCNNPRLYPTIFEYYSAIEMTNRIGKPFFIYNNFSSIIKGSNNFPVQDKGIDLIEPSLSIVGQCKYYSNKSTITYGKLSTFLASDKLVGKKLEYYLIRTDECKLDSLVKKMIDRGEMYDIKIYKEEFIENLKTINKE